MAANSIPIPAGSNPLAAVNPAARGTGTGIVGTGPGFPVGVGPIPTFTFIAGGGGSAVPAAGTLNGVATTSQTRQAQVVAENAVLRLVYGRTTLGAQIADILFYNGNLVIVAVWGYGPWNAIETVYFDDKAPPTGATVTNYTGTQVAADATLVAAYAAQSPAITYTDILPNIVYSVIVLPPNLSTGFPRISATVQGLKVYDPRDGTQTLGTPSTYKYSDCPALAIADLQTNATYGANDAVDWTSVAAVANDNDALVGGTEKRRIIGLALDTVQMLPAWFEALRAYAGCFLARSAGKLVLISDRPASSTFTFLEATSAGNCRVSKVRRRSKRDAPTVSAVRYTDTTVFPWRDNIAYAYAAGALAGTVSWKIHEVALPGITRYSHAVREATEQLNKLRLTDLTLDIAGQDEALTVTVGDVVTVSANLGLTSRAVRVLNVNTQSLGRPVFSCEGYDATVYSDGVASGPSIVDTSLPNPAALSPPTSLVITETPYLEQVNGSALAGGLIYQSRFDCTWTAPALGFPVNYRVEVLDGATKVRDEFVSGTAYSTPTLQQGKTYTVKVYTRNTITESVALVGSKLVAGNTNAPASVLAITSARELGGDVLLEISPSVSVDVIRYEWRYYPNGTGSWAAATFIDRVDGLRARFKGLPVGTHRFYVRAINSVGLYSASDAVADVTVTSDANAFIQGRTFTAPTLTNMVSIPAVEDGTNAPRWATGIAADAFNTTEPNPFNSGANPVISYHASATQKWQGESWDLGSTVTGDWTLVVTVSDITGTATYALETSPDGSTWTAQPGISWKGGTRFIRPAINNTTTGTMVITGAPQISLAALSKTESNRVTTLASGGLLVSLTGQYSAAQDLQATAVNTSSPRLVVVDRILLHPQTGLMHQITYNGAGDNFSYMNFSAAARVVASGDFIEYDSFIDPASPTTTGTAPGGGIYMTFTDATNTNALAATDGETLRGPPTTASRGVWRARKASMAAYVGKTTNIFASAMDGDASSGVAKILLRNVRFTDGAGTVRQTIWSSGEPTLNTSGGASLVANVMLGPSNSFNLYAFTDAGAQVAQDVQYSFRGF